MAASNAPIDIPSGRKFEQTVADIAASIKKRQLAVFCGAGISRYSGLPLAKDIVSAVLDKLGLDNATRETLESSALPFEGFMDALRAETDDTTLLGVFAIGNPNTNHVLLAKLAAVGLVRALFTVNFDCLIEAALDGEHLRPGADYWITHNDEDFDAIDWTDATKVRVIKLHGSISDPAHMAVTLHQVADRQLATRRQAAIERLFSSGGHRDVLILGYSCSDLFDITPIVEMLPDKSKRIFLVQHAADADPQAESLAGSGGSPFNDFPAALKITCDTDLLIKALWQQCLEVPYVAPLMQVSDWKPFIDGWFGHVVRTPGAPFALAGHLLARISAWDRAATCFDAAAAGARNAGALINTGRYLSNLGLAYTHTGRFEQAAASHRDAIEIARAVGSRYDEATNLQNLANAEQQVGRSKQAMFHYQQAARLATELNNAEGIAASYASLGMLVAQERRFWMAEEFLDYALEVADKNTKLINQARIWGDLGGLYQLAGVLLTAARCYTRAVELARKIGLREAEGKSLGNLGLVQLLLGDYDAARQNLAESRRIDHLCGDIQGEAKCLGALGRLYQMTGDYPQAIAHSHQSLEIGKTLGDPLIVVQAALQLMDIHQAAGDLPAAADARATAQSAARNFPQLQRIIREHAASPPLAPQDPLWMREGMILYWRRRYRMLLAVDVICCVIAAAALVMRFLDPTSLVTRWSLVPLAAAGAVLAVLHVKWAGRAGQGRWQLDKLSESIGAPEAYEARRVHWLAKGFAASFAIVAVALPLFAIF